MFVTSDLSAFFSSSVWRVSPLIKPVLPTSAVPVPKASCHLDLSSSLKLDASLLALAITASLLARFDNAA